MNRTVLLWGSSGHRQKPPWWDPARFTRLRGGSGSPGELNLRWTMAQKLPSQFQGGFVGARIVGVHQLAVDQPGRCDHPAGHLPPEPSSPKARKSAIGPFHRSGNQAQPMPQLHIVVADKQQPLRRDSIWRAIPKSSRASKSVIIHTLRTIQTSSTITIMVPTSPNPSISFLLFTQWSIS